MSGTITTDNITDIVDQLATLSRYIVENVKSDDATFIHFFGSPKYYQNVMDVFSRLADIRTGAIGAGEELHIVTDMDVDRNGPGGHQEIASFSFQELVPTITLYSPFRDLDDIFRKGPGHNEAGQLVYLRSSRQALLLHELIHFVTNKIHYPPIVPKYKNSVGFLFSAAIDVKLADACGWGEKKWIFDKSDVVFESKKELEKAVVYGEFRTLLLAQLKYGPRYAVHNADNYALFAIEY
ncbi:hypothetical protein HYFRA_00011901 [Hymenoscyphus fraxineus]|uniref:Uncharacterized protein n=1 Tax=Hymenoscyphus fraxineus TaxID=746836 RepID=A0A9N9KY67_9HELO|nr:hypothetical protein HYFRA_00011901 [Hymenoscyphus fraxineus]